MATAPSKRPARKASSRRTAAASASTSAPRKTAKRVAKKTTQRAASVERNALQVLGAGKKALSSGLSAAHRYAEKGGRSLKAAGRAAKGYGEVVVREAKRNPKLAGAIAAGVVSIGSAMIVRKLNRGPSREMLAARANQATQALTRKATQAAELLAEKMREISAH